MPRQAPSRNLTLLLALGAAVGGAACCALTAWAPRRAFALAPWPFVPFVVLFCCALRFVKADDRAPGERGTSRSIARGSLALVVLAALAAYLPTLDLPFIDPEDWYHLILVRETDRLGLPAALAAAWTHVHPHPAMLVRCLHLVIWYVEDRIFRGFGPGYHATSLALHAGTALLVQRLARRLGLDRGAALAAAILFVVAPSARGQVRDPTGLPELSLGFLYVLGLLVWLPGTEARSTNRPAALRLARAAIVIGLIFTRDAAFTFPLVLVALTAALEHDRSAGPSPGAGARFRSALRASWPTWIVPVVQLALHSIEMVRDPTSGRSLPVNSFGEFGDFARGISLMGVSGGFLRDLPRVLLFPVWDKDPAARWAPIVVLTSLAWLATARWAGRRHRGLVAASVIFTAAPMLLVFPFTSWEGPKNVHLLYASTIGAALFCAASWASIEHHVVRRVAAAGLAAAVVASVAFHWSQVPGERLLGSRTEAATAWIDALERDDRLESPVVLVGGTAPGYRRWDTALLSVQARTGTWRHGYTVVRRARRVDASSTAGGRPPLIAGFDESGHVLRLHPGANPLPAGLDEPSAAHSPCDPLAFGPTRTNLCAVGPALPFDSLRRVLLSM